MSNSNKLRKGPQKQRSRRKNNKYPKYFRWLCLAGVVALMRYYGLARLWIISLSCLLCFQVIQGCRKSDRVILIDFELATFDDPAEALKQNKADTRGIMRELERINGRRIKQCAEERERGRQLKGDIDWDEAMMHVIVPPME